MNIKIIIGKYLVLILKIFGYGLYHCSFNDEHRLVTKNSSEAKQMDVGAYIYQLAPHWFKLLMKIRFLNDSIQLQSFSG